jgi:hypothetical protein
MQRTRRNRAERAMYDVPDLRWVDQLSDLMDSRFQLPGTRFRFGLDPILGLIPGIGDAVSLAVSGLLISYMYRHGASGKALVKMIGNVLLDAIIGSIPILGSIFDFAYKANERNIRIMKEHYQEGKHQGSGKGILILVGLFIFIFIGLIIWGTWELVEWIINYAQTAF